ncbi:MAG TPA: HAD-IIIA family hydrolase [Kiritimatiellia bacterium]|nr:HAD-IIIA family hydrolase [Kiritimatiellia bacterium]HRU71512.1 HAD-IIIA family hydrolase [Kiritimatiellia bacterium]
MLQAAQPVGARAALFLDRDGTVIRDVGYLSDPDGVELLPGAKEALHRVCGSHRLYLLTNQSGIGRGYYTLEQAEAVNARMMAMLELPEPGFTAVCIAPETSEQPAVYRKPSPAFILERIAADGLDPVRCWMIGDRLSDLQAGVNAGIATALIHNDTYFNEQTRAFCDEHRIPIYPSLCAALAVIVPERPLVRFTPEGKVSAAWMQGHERHEVLFDRPGDLAEQRFAALAPVSRLEVADGKQGCEHLFFTVPFTDAALPEPAFGATLTPAYRAAFTALIDRDTPCDDFWMIRGEPGEFAVGARRQGAVWRVAGVTAAAQTLTVRFEDLWLRTPAALRALRYTVQFLRDPIAGEGGEVIDETFEGQAPDVRVLLDLARDGGFLLTFRPQAQTSGR